MKAALIILAVIAAIFAVLFFVGGYAMYRFSIVRDKRGKRQVNCWEDGA